MYAARRAIIGRTETNIPKMGKEVLDLRSATQEQKQDFVTLMDKYDQKKENFEQQAKEEREKIMNEFEQNFKVLGKAIDIEQEK